MRIPFPAVEYRWTLVACGFAFIGWDLVVGLLRAFEPRARQSGGAPQAFFNAVYGVGQALVAVYFLVQARALSRPLLAYVDHRDSDPRRNHAANIRWVALWLSLSGASMLANTAILVTLAALRDTSAFLFLYYCPIIAWVVPGITTSPTKSADTIFHPNFARYELPGKPKTKK